MREEEKEEKRGEDRSQMYRSGREMRYAGCCCVHDSIHIFTDIYTSYNSYRHQTKALITYSTIITRVIQKRGYRNWKYYVLFNNRYNNLKR